MTKGLLSEVLFMDVLCTGCDIRVHDTNAVRGIAAPFVVPTSSHDHDTFPQRIRHKLDAFKNPPLYAVIVHSAQRTLQRAKKETRGVVVAPVSSC